MREIQLYIGTDRVELFGGDSVSITESIKNAKDISKVFTTFSKQFTVPASKINNKIFKHYYNYHITNGFDARIKQDATIEINNLPFRRGKIKLDGVDMRSNKAYAYRVTFYGSVVELKDLLGEDKLPSLTVGANSLDIDMPYDSDSIKTNLTNLTSVDKNSTSIPGVSLPLITHSQRLYFDSSRPSIQSGNLYYGSVNQGVKFDELKYAVRLDKIIEAIESKYTTGNGYASNISFASGCFFDAAQATDITKLYMWCHRKKGKVDISQSTPVKATFISGGGSYPPGSYGSTMSGSTLTIDVATGQSLDLTITTNSDFAYTVDIYKNGSIYKTVEQAIGDQLIGVTFTQNDEFEVYLSVYEKDADFNTIKWDFIWTPTSGPNITDTYTSNLSNSSLTVGYEFNIAENLPDMTIIDFLSNIFKMFNLVAYVNDNNDIYVEPLDDFYGTTERDLSKYIDVETSQVNVALPYKEIFFKYADTKTILAEQHLQEISEVEWGGVEYTDTTNLSGGIYKMEPAFHHAKYEKLLDFGTSLADTGVQVGYFVTDNEEAYLGKPLILYINNIQANKSVGFLSRNSRSEITTASGINMPSNTEIINNASSSNIHFNAEKSEYTDTVATETLFKRFYQSYIENVFASSSRIIKMSAVLPAGQMIQIDLSDIIIINSNRYRINSMDIELTTGRTSFELINYYD